MNKGRQRFLMIKMILVNFSNECMCGNTTNNVVARLVKVREHHVSNKIADIDRLFSFRTEIT